MSRGGKFNRPSWKNQYSEHDFRGSDSRKVSFKSHKNGPRKERDWVSATKMHLLDEDIDMGLSGATTIGGRNRGKKFFNGNRRGAGRDSPAPRRGRLLDTHMSWFRVLLPYGNKYEKSFVLKTLLDKVQPLPFWPLVWGTNGNQASFYIDEFKVAEKLQELDRQIQMPDGFKLIIRVNSGMPYLEINNTVKEKIKLAMAKRYNAANKALDLTKFHNDSDLQDYFCALFKQNVFLTVLDIISENIPELEALNLFENRISNMTYLKRLTEKLPNLKILHVGNNRFRDLSMLDSFIGLPIVDLVLNGNPLCAKYKDQELYISEVRKHFPKVMKLDGVDLPPPIGFDISEETSLPPSNQTFLCNQEGEAIVRQFLQAYFEIFDSPNRQPLLQAYHEAAVMSITMAYPYGQRDKDKGGNWLNWYSTDNRNLHRVQDPERRQKLLKQGQVAVVSFLQDMPFTKHDVHSFTVDLVVFTPQMITLTVTGMFKELKTGHKVPPTRAFFRTLVIVPAGSGFCIINETLHVTNATEEQTKTMFKAALPVSSTPVASPNISVASPNISTASPNVSLTYVEDSIKQKMISSLSDQSGMNLEWSTKCLEENQFDFTRAASAFSEAKDRGIIPPEAFVK